MICKDCIFRNVYCCDHGHAVDPKKTECVQFAPVKEATTVLKSWQAFAPVGTVERIYIDAMIDILNLRPVQEQVFNAAVDWLYRAKDSLDARSIRASVQVFHNFTPI
jgi:hypothetical protein